MLLAEADQAKKKPAITHFEPREENCRRERWARGGERGIPNRPLRPRNAQVIGVEKT